MPAAQDKIVYLHFICNYIVKSMAYVSLCEHRSTGSWHGDLRRYKHENLLAIFFFMCKVASGSPAVTSQTSLIFSFAQSVNNKGCGTGCYIELHVWSGHQHERAR